MKNEKIACSHCHLEFEPNVMIEQQDKDVTHYFCCKGCQGVYNLINDAGLERFYDRSKEVVLTPQSKTFEESKSFDLPAFRQQYTKKNGALLEVSLIIEGIHCSACVWLNERILHDTEGVVSAQINFSTNKAKIVWDPTQIELSKIIDTIRSIGYDAYAYDPTINETNSSSASKEYMRRLIVAVFATMNIMWIAIAQYAGYFTGIEEGVKNILNGAEWILSTPVLFYSGWIFFKGAYFGLKNRYVNMDVLVATGASLAYIYSIVITLSQSGEAYFDSVAMIITFVLFGKYLEVLTKSKASDTLDKLNKHLSLDVNKITQEGIQHVLANELVVGDVVEVKAGERFAIDGVIIQGEGYIDESTITGENEPIFKKMGDKVISGTSCINTVLHVKVQSTFENSTYKKLLNLLEDSLASKPKIEQLANKVSGYFSTVILLLALGTFIGWLSPLGGMQSFDISFMVAISVIVIACPCALALATPVATLVGVSMGAKKGVLFKQAAYLETLANAKHVFVDKTGTLTQGYPKVIDAIVDIPFNQNILYTMVDSSIHPISKALKRWCDTDEIVQNTNVEVVAGKGIILHTSDAVWYGGNALFLQENGIEIQNSPSSRSLFYIGSKGKLYATYHLEDTIKEGAKALMSYFNKQNIDVTMLTGDTLSSAKTIAKQLNIPNVQAHLTPNLKAQYIQVYKEKTNDAVVMVGDGINDTIALANADIAIAMGKGADIAIDSSDVVLLHDDLVSLKEAFVIAKRSFVLIKQNLALSLIYNTITIPLAMAGYIIPLIAALSMSFSSLLVVGNSLRIKRFKG